MWRIKEYGLLQVVVQDIKWYSSVIVLAKDTRRLEAQITANCNSYAESLGYVWVFLAPMGFWQTAGSEKNEGLTCCELSTSTKAVLRAIEFIWQPRASLTVQIQRKSSNFITILFWTWIHINHEDATREMSIFIFSSVAPLHLPPCNSMFAFLSSFSRR